MSKLYIFKSRPLRSYTESLINSKSSISTCILTGHAQKYLFYLSILHGFFFPIDIIQGILKSPKNLPALHPPLKFN